MPPDGNTPTTNRAELSLKDDKCQTDERETLHCSQRHTSRCETTDRWEQKMPRRTGPRTAAAALPTAPRGSPASEEGQPLGGHKSRPGRRRAFQTRMCPTTQPPSIRTRTGRDRQGVRAELTTAVGDVRDAALVERGSRNVVTCSHEVPGMRLAPQRGAASRHTRWISKA